MVHTPHHKANQMPLLASKSSSPRRDGASRPVSSLPTWITQQIGPPPLVRQPNSVTSSPSAGAAIPRSLERTRLVSFISVCRSHRPAQGCSLPQLLRLRFHLHLTSSSFHPTVMSMSVSHVVQAATLLLALFYIRQSSPPSPRLREVCTLDWSDLLLPQDLLSVQQSWTHKAMSKPNR